MPGDDRDLPLSGIKVVDYTHFLAGPYVSRCLASMGAEVVKVERPRDGEAGRAHPYFVGGQSGYFLQKNVDKQGLCVNVKDPRGLDLVRRLVADADVFVENYRPGALDKLGLGYEALSAINPRLVYCSVSAYGHTGPNASKAGFGLMAEAKSGAMAQMGEPGTPPPLLRMPIADMYTGVHGVAAVCATLFGRLRSGRGRHIDMALYDCTVSMHDFAIQAYTLSGRREIPAQVGHHLPDSAIYGVFSGKDGHLVIAAQVEEAWLRLARLVGGDALASDTRFHGSTNRNANRLEAVRAVEDWCGAQASVAACIARLDAADVPCAPVQRIDEVMADPQVAARGMIVEQDHPTIGRVRLPNVPFRFSEADISPRRLAPRLGEHNRTIAAGLGYTQAEIAELERAGVLHQAPDIPAR